MRLSLTAGWVAGATASAVPTPSSTAIGMGSANEVGVVVEATRRSPSCSDRANWPSSWPGTEPEAS